MSSLAKALFYIVYKERDLPSNESRPEIFQLINVKGSNVHATTQDLISLNIRLRQISDDCLHLTEKHLVDILDKIFNSIESLANLSESLSLV